MQGCLCAGAGLPGPFHGGVTVPFRLLQSSGPRVLARGPCVPCSLRTVTWSASAARRASTGMLSSARWQLATSGSPGHWREWDARCHGAGHARSLRVRSPRPRGPRGYAPPPGRGGRAPRLRGRGPGGGRINWTGRPPTVGLPHWQHGEPDARAPARHLPSASACGGQPRWLAWASSTPGPRPFRVTGRHARRKRRSSVMPRPTEPC
jgi:hypothetical protein